MTQTVYATSGIVAQAFDLMELNPPSSLADNSSKATAADRAYARARDVLLAKADWSFARAIVDLNEIDTVASGFAEDPDLPFSYDHPAQAIKVWRLVDKGVRWRRDGAIIRADTGPVQKAKITVRATDESKFSEPFQLAVAYELARVLAPRLATSLSKKRDLREEAAEALADALKDDAIAGTAERYDELENDEYSDIVSEALR